MILAKRNHNSLDLMFDELFGNWDPVLTRDWGKARLGNVARYPIRTSNSEDGIVTIEFDVPGADKADMEIHYDEEFGTLTVSSKSEEQTSTDKVKTVSQRSFSYSVSAHDLDSETIEATCDKGILTVTGKPKIKAPSKRKIEIK